MKNTEVGNTDWKFTVRSDPEHIEKIRTREKGRRNVRIYIENRNKKYWRKEKK